MQPEDGSHFEYQRTVSGDVITSRQILGSDAVQELDVSLGGRPSDSSHCLRISRSTHGLLYRGYSMPWPVLKPPLHPHYYFWVSLPYYSIG